MKPLRRRSDALSGGPAAGAAGAPTLLVKGRALPGSTVAQLKALAPTRLVVLGGTGVIRRELAAAAAAAAR